LYHLSLSFTLIHAVGALGLVSSTFALPSPLSSGEIEDNQSQSSQLGPGQSGRRNDQVQNSPFSASKPDPARESASDLVPAPTAELGEDTLTAPLDSVNSQSPTPTETAEDALETATEGGDEQVDTATLTTDTGSAPPAEETGAPVVGEEVIDEGAGVANISAAECAAQFIAQAGIGGEEGGNDLRGDPENRGNGQAGGRVQRGGARELLQEMLKSGKKERSTV
jgi:hypothetical protein